MPLSSVQRDEFGPKTIFWEELFDGEAHNFVSDAAFFELQRSRRETTPLPLIWTLRAEEDGVEVVNARAEELCSEGWTLRQGPTVQMGAPIRWGHAVKSDRSWGFSLNSWEPVIDLLHAHRMTDETAFLRRAKEMILDWSVQNFLADRPNTMRWHDHATANRALVLAYLLDRELHSADPDPAFFVQVMIVAEQHLDRLQNKKWWGRTNHSLFVTTAMRALLHAMPGHKRAASWQKQAGEHFTWVLRQQYSGEGFHTEDAPGYHLAITEILDEISHLHLFDDQKEAFELTRLAKERTPLLFHPNGELLNIGDQAGGRVRISDDVKAFLTSEGETGRAPAWPGFIFPDTGWVVYRTPFTKLPFSEHDYLFMSAVNHGSGHTHADFGGIEWTYHGTPVLVDSGGFSYNRDRVRSFFQSARAGNTIEISGSTSDVKRATKGVFLKGGGKLRDDVRWAQASIPLNDGVEHVRILVWSDDGWLLVIDDTRSRKAHQMNQWFHLHEDLEVKQGTLGAQILSSGRHLLRIRSTAALAAPGVLRGQDDPENPGGWISRSTGTRTPRSSLAFSSVGRTNTIVTTFHSDDEQMATADVDDDEAVVQFGTNQWRVPVVRGAARSIAIPKKSQ